MDNRYATIDAFLTSIEKITKNLKNLTDNKSKLIFNPESLGDPMKKVFIVSGRNSKIRDAMFEFLRALELYPQEWTHLVKMTEKGSPYVGDILNVGMHDAGAIIILMTGDEEVKLKDKFLNKDEESTIEQQPRPNVIFEAGLAFGLNRNNTIIIEFGKIRKMSDILGIHVILMDNSPEKRKELVERLKSTKCNVNDQGIDWLKAGNFSV